MSLFHLTPTVPFLHSNSKPIHIQTWSWPLFLSGNISCFTSLSVFIPVLIFCYFLNILGDLFLPRKSSFRNSYAMRILHLLFFLLTNLSNWWHRFNSSQSCQTSFSQKKEKETLILSRVLWVIFMNYILNRSPSLYYSSYLFQNSFFLICSFIFQNISNSDILGNFLKNAICTSLILSFISHWGGVKCVTLLLKASIYMAESSLLDLFSTAFALEF